jgi:phage host-nuclease inhibitor protein Gam
VFFEEPVKFSDIETSVQTLDTSVNEKINEVAVTASGQVDNLRGELSAVDDEIKGRVDTLEETSAQQSDVDDINNKIGEIDSSVNMIESDVINIKKSLGEGWINVADLLNE